MFASGSLAIHPQAKSMGFSALLIKQCTEEQLDYIALQVEKSRSRLTGDVLIRYVVGIFKNVLNPGVMSSQIDCPCSGETVSVQIGDRIDEIAVTPVRKNEVQRLQYGAPGYVKTPGREYYLPCFYVASETNNDGGLMLFVECRTNGAQPYIEDTWCMLSDFVIGV